MSARRRRPRFVVVTGPGLCVLLKDWSWIELDYLARINVPPAVHRVWVFPSRRRANRARRSYGRGACRQMEVMRVDS